MGKVVKQNNKGKVASKSKVTKRNTFQALELLWVCCMLVRTDNSPESTRRSTRQKKTPVRLDPATTEEQWERKHTEMWEKKPGECETRRKNGKLECKFVWENSILEKNNPSIEKWKGKIVKHLPDETVEVSWMPTWEPVKN